MHLSFSKLNSIESTESIEFVENYFFSCFENVKYSLLQIL